MPSMTVIGKPLTPTHKPRKLYTMSLLGLLIGHLSACSAVSIKKQDPVKQLVAERENIITSKRLSSHTQAMIKLSGLDKKSCFRQIQACFATIDDNQLVKHNRKQLAVYAEIHYAYAKEQEKWLSNAKNSSLQNLSLQKMNRQQISQQISQQEKQYLQHLLQAIRYSYAYLFFDSLTDSSNRPKSVQSLTNLANELDIQTQDIYNAVSHQLISLLYQKQSNSQLPSNAQNLSDLQGSSVDVNTVDVNTVNTLSTKDIDTNNPFTDRTHINAMDIQLAGADIHIYFPNDPAYITKTITDNSTLVAYPKVDSLIPTAGIQMSGLNAVSKRDGLGISYVSQLTNRHTTSIKQKLTQDGNDLSDPSTRIHPTGNLLVTALLTPQGNSLTEVLNSQAFNLHLYNPYKTKQVNILGKNYPLSGNFSASYALWIYENEHQSVAFLNMLNRRQSTPLPHLYMLEPYNPDKKVIIMIHGLASSPITWVGVTNDIFNDETLRDNYQVWQIFYSTNLPMLENRYQIQQLIERAYQQTDPTGQASASQQSVIIGHSMGGIMTRMMLSDDNLTNKLSSLIDPDNINSNTSDKPADKQSEDNLRSQQLLQAYQEPVFRERFQLKHLPQIDTAVFISAPLRGTDFADKWFTKALRSIIQLPAELADINDADVIQNPLASLFLQNGASQLSDESSFMKLTGDIRIHPDVGYHSIMGNFDIKQEIDNIRDEIRNLTDDELIVIDNKLSVDTPLMQGKNTHSNGLNINDKIDKDLEESIHQIEQIEEMKNSQVSDGIVPYQSSHLAGAITETVISGGHDIHSNPKTVTQLRKILHAHLNKHSQQDYSQNK